MSVNKKVWGTSLVCVRCGIPMEWETCSGNDRHGWQTTFACPLCKFEIMFHETPVDEDVGMLRQNERHNFL
jgi:DNA-directed RNA polymerase subunit RPC12/RpoP